MSSVCLLPPKRIITNDHLKINKQSKSESETQQVQTTIMNRTNSSQNLNIQRMNNWMHGMNGINEWKDCTRAYTGIASDTPVGVHLSPHLTKCGDPNLVWKTFHTGVQICPYWNWWVLRAHTGIDGSFQSTPVDGTWQCPNLPTLEWWVLQSTPVDETWIMDAWNELLNKEYHHL